MCCYIKEYDFNYVSSNILEKTTMKCAQSHFSEKSLNVVSIENGIVLPSWEGKGGIVDGEGKYYRHSFVHRGVGGAYDFNESNCEYFDEEVVYLGMWHDVWGHWITDNLKLLWFLFDEKYRELKSLKFVYTTLWPTFAFCENSKELLKRLGIDEDNIVRITSITKFKKIYLPDDCFINDENKGCWYTKDYKSIVNRIISVSSSTIHDKGFNSCDRVYFTRTKFKNNVDYGEERIEQVFRNLGYVIMSPERMSLDEQIKVLNHCKVLAATEGSITHNAVFMKEGASLVAVRKYDNVNEYQLAINEMRALHVTYVDSHRSTRVDKSFPYKGPFFLYCSKNLSRFANCRKPLFPIFSYIHYLWTYRPRHIVKRVFKRITWRVFAKWKR